jgi:hypothetical protein
MAFRTNRSGTVNGSAVVESTTPMFVRDQNLYDCLAGYENDKGKRVPGCKISLWIELGNVKLCVNDDHYGRVGFAVLNTGMKLSQAIEEVLECDGIEWRPRTGKKTNS